MNMWAVITEQVDLSLLTTILRREDTEMKNGLVKKMVIVMTGAVLFAGILTGCGKTKEAPAQDAPAGEKETTDMVSEEAEKNDAPETKEPEQPQEKVELTVLAAASLTDVCNELKTIYENQNPNVTVNISYGGSGALQTQIEEGAPADVFISAAMKQMTALDEKNLMDSESIVKLLENKVVLIVPSKSDISVTSFEDAATDAVKIIGLGEPGSVPVGQYSEEIFGSLNILDAVKAKANYGSDVRTVLSWVETSAVDCGVVYATDAYTSKDVKIVCEAPEGSCKKVIYPAGIVAASEKKEAAAAWLAFIQNEESMKLFESYGFSKAPN